MPCGLTNDEDTVFTGFLPSIQALHRKGRSKECRCLASRGTEMGLDSDEDKFKVRNPTNCDRAIWPAARLIVSKGVD